MPALTSALFAHRGPLRHLSATFNHAHGTWLPRSEYEPADGPELERYDDRFREGGDKCELDFLIPVKPKRR